MQRASSIGDGNGHLTECPSCWTVSVKDGVCAECRWYEDKEVDVP